MSARNGDLQRALDVALAFHVGEINVVTLMRREKFLKIAARRLKGSFAAEKRKCFP